MYIPTDFQIEDMNACVCCLKQKALFVLSQNVSLCLEFLVNKLVICAKLDTSLSPVSTLLEEPCRLRLRPSAITSEVCYHPTCFPCSIDLPCHLHWSQPLALVSHPTGVVGGGGRGRQTSPCPWLVPGGGRRQPWVPCRLLPRGVVPAACSC